MAGLGREGIPSAERCLPLNERSFRLLILQYNEEAAAARAVALRGNENSSSSGADLTVAAQYMEDLARDATRLYNKLQAGGGVKGGVGWTEEDLKALHMLGFDVRHIDGSWGRDVNEHASALHAAPRLHTANLDALFSVEQKMRELQEKVDVLTCENLLFRRAVSRKPPNAPNAQHSIHNAPDPLAALTDAFNGLKDAYQMRRREDSLVQRMREKFAMALHDIRVADRKRCVAGVKQSEYPYTVIEDAFYIVQSIDACRRVRYCIGKNSNIVEEPVDTAVIQLLNDLDFSFPIHIRRLGPGGDYFIDRHVEIKLMDGQLLVGPRLSTRHSSSSDVVSCPRYEHLAKYLIHLYSPVMDLEKAAGKDDDVVEEEEEEQEEEEQQYPSASNNSDARGRNILFEGHITFLRRQERDLQRTLNSHHEELRRHQQQLESSLHSSHDVSQLDHVAVGNRVQTLHTNGNATTELSSKSCGEDRVARTLLMLETNGNIPDLSAFSESELCSLRRTALRRQMRTLQGLSGVVSPRLQGHSL